MTLQRLPTAPGDDSGYLLRLPACRIQPIAMRLWTLCELPGRRRENPGQPWG